MDPQSPILPLTLEAFETPVVLTGVLDHYQAETLRERLLEAVSSPLNDTKRLLKVDMSEVEQIDACCLQVLLACKPSQSQAKLAIEGANPSVRQWIRTAGADVLFDFTDGNN